MTAWGLTVLLGLALLAAGFAARSYRRRWQRAEIQIHMVKEQHIWLLREQPGFTLKVGKIGNRYTYIFGDGQLIYALGFTQNDIGKTLEELVPPDKLASLRAIYDRAWAGESFQYESEFNGYILLNHVQPLIEDGATVALLIVASDITERAMTEKAIQESEDRYRRLVDLSPDAIVVISDFTFILVNRKAVQIMGADTHTDLMEKPVLELIHPDYLERAREHFRQVFESKETLPPTESKYVRLDGQSFSVETTATWMIYNGNPAVMVIFRDITERKLAEQQLQESNQLLAELALSDGLTGIANRRYLDEMLEKEWQLAMRNSLPISLIIFDIDYFKDYNDSYGHQDGDDCLKTVADALHQYPWPGGGFIARYGGEEFVAVLPGMEGQAAARIAQGCGELIESLAIPHRTSKISEHITMSVGVSALIPTPNVNQETLIGQADVALYKAKMLGRNQVQVFNYSLLAQE